MLNLLEQETGEPTKCEFMSMADTVVESVVVSCCVPAQIRDHRSTVLTPETLAFCNIYPLHGLLELSFTH